MMQEMKNKVLKTLAYAAIFVGLSVSATAEPTFSVSPVVVRTDRSATFDSLTANGLDLSAYTEDLLSVAVAGTTDQGFEAFTPGDARTTAFHYASGGNSSFVTISGTDDAVFNALDFLLGDGQLALTTNVRWETYLGGSLTGSGTESAVPKGAVMGWVDLGGFDELRVAAASSEELPGFGNHQSVAIDDLRAQLVPEPDSLALGTVTLFSLGLLRLARDRQQRRN